MYAISKADERRTNGLAVGAGVGTMGAGGYSAYQGNQWRKGAQTASRNRFFHNPDGWKFQAHLRRGAARRLGGGAAGLAGGAALVGSGVYGPKKEPAAKADTGVRMPGAKYSVGGSPDRRKEKGGAALAVGGLGGFVGGSMAAERGLEAGRKKLLRGGLAGMAAGAGAIGAGAHVQRKASNRIYRDEGHDEYIRRSLLAAGGQRVGRKPVGKADWPTRATSIEMRPFSSTVPGRGSKKGQQAGWDRSGSFPGFGQRDRNAFTSQSTTRVVARTPSGKFVSHANDLQSYTITPKHRRDSRLERHVKKADTSSLNAKMPAAARRGTRLPR